MKKLYYKIELRIERMDAFNRREDDWIKYYSTGYVIIDNGNIEGYLTMDLISGIISNSERIHIQLIEHNENKEDKFHTFSGVCEDLELPGEYELEEDQNPNIFAEILFIESVKKVAKQKKIRQELKRVKTLHPILS